MEPISILRKLFILIFFPLLLFSACESTSSDSDTYEISPGDEAQAAFQEALNAAKEGETITLGEGTFEFNRTMTMDAKSGVIIRGQGRENTILSFAGQVSGADGLLITNSEDIIVSDLTIADTQGDGLKFRESNGIVIRNVGTIWSGEPSTDNGAYGIYPVLSSNILIEDCYAYGASDSGIYVGQSDKAIVRNSTAEGNVAGIEIENTTNADVYGNTVTDNAAGILVFDLPGLSQSGAKTRIFDNTVTNNLRENFAPGGSIVAEAPAGTGILVLSTNKVEIFNNKLQENNVAGTAVASYAALVKLGLAPQPTDPDYNPFPGNIYIHDNSYSSSANYPTGEDQSDFGNILVQTFSPEPIPDIILDGIFAPESGASGTICIEDNTGNSFVNLNLPNDFPQNMSFDQSPHACSMEALPEVEISVPGA